MLTAFCKQLLKLPGQRPVTTLERLHQGAVLGYNYLVKIKGVGRGTVSFRRIPSLSQPPHLLLCAGRQEKFFLIVA